MTTTLGKVCDIYTGNSINANYKKTHFEGLAEGFPFIATKDVSFNGQVDYDNGVKIPYNTKYKKAYCGSVLLCAEGGSAGRKIARINQTVCFGNKLFCLAPKDNSLMQDFLYYYLLSDSFQEQFRESIAGVIGGVSNSKIKAFNITFPDLDEQRKIVERLNAAFERIDRMQINAETALEEAKGALAQIIRNSFIPAKDWEEKSIGDLSKDIRYGTSKPSCENGKYLYLRMNNITSDGHLTLKDTKTISLEGAEYEKAVVRKGDILFNRTNSLEHVGKTCVFDQEEEMIIAGYLIRVRLKEEIIPEFLSYFLNCDTTKTTLRKLAIGAVHQANISASSLKKVRLKFPENKAEQERIVTQIKKIEDKIKALKCNLDTITEKCNALKQALLKETFE